jgi:2-polyprenyl-6-hydroxyphenyl methylase/3-demethylubiquinone-9 3-methyltransferase
LRNFKNKSTEFESVEFHETLAKKWSAGYNSGGFHLRKRFFRALLETVVQTNSRWLDAGCGSGVLTRELSSLGAIGLAVDASPAMIEVANKEGFQDSQRFSYKLVTTIEKLDLPNASFDGVLCSSVIEYVNEPEKALSEFFRIIKPGGVLLVSAPNRLSPIRLSQKFIRTILNISGKNCFSYLAVSKNDFRASQFRKLMESFGFIVGRIDIFDPLLPHSLSIFSLGSLFTITAFKPDSKVES